LDWNILNPARNLSIFVKELELLEHIGIDDEEMPVTTDADRVINIVPEEDDDSVAGMMEPRAAFQEGNAADAPAIIQETQDGETEDDEARADRENKAQRLENNEMRKLDTSYNPMARQTMYKHNVVEDEAETVRIIYFFHHNELSSDFGEPKTFEAAWNGLE
jgi:hypothetical protein